MESATSSSTAESHSPIAPPPVSGTRRRYLSSSGLHLPPWYNARLVERVTAYVRLLDRQRVEQAPHNRALAVGVEAAPTLYNVAIGEGQEDCVVVVGFDALCGAGLRELRLQLLAEIHI